MKNAIKKIMAFVLVIAMVAGVLPSVFAASEYVEPFKDVKTTDWFAPYVTYVYEHDPQLMNGVTKDTFAPNGTCTRAMAAVVLYRLADPVIPSVKPSTFTDLKQDWYKNGIAWAQQNGVVNGVTETTFVPDGLVLREQLVTMLWRYAGEPKVAEDYLKSFPDREKVSYYAREAFNWAISLEIIGGANGMLNPQGNATRAEFAKILSVFAQKTAPCQHKWDEGKVTKEATCTATGVMTYTCTLCGETKTETIPMIAHNYVDGVCSVCGAQEPDPGPGPGPGPEPTPGNEYVLASEIKDGDEVIIYNPGHGKAIKNENDNNWYLIAQEITPADSKITTDDTTIVWTANKNDDGTFTFTNGENAITAWLSENDKGTFVELTNDANYTGGDTKWNVTTCNAATNTFFISSSSIATSYGPGHIECYAKSGVDKIAGFGKANPTETDFGFQFYVKGGTAPDPGPGPEPTPGNEYVLASEIKDGDEVIIYNPGHGKAIKNENDNNWYLIAQEITPADSKITTDDTTIVWTANKNDDGTFTFTNGENAITAWLSENDKGTFVELTNDANYTGGDTKWNVTTCNAATNTFFISSSSIATSYGPGHIECYAKSGVDKIAGFGKANPTETDFGFQFYVKGGTAPDPGPGPEPTPGNEYVLTSELKEGDEVVIVCAAKNMALSSTYGGNYNNGVAVTPTDGKITNPAADIVWIVGKEGDFYTFSFEGKKIAMGTGYTSMPLGEVNYKWQLQNAATEGAFYLANLDREAGKEYRMQWREEKSYWSAYHTIAEGAEELFALNFYVKGGEAACAHEWDEGEVTKEATCTDAGVKTFTCTKCQATKTESIAALGHIDENNDDKCDHCGADLSTPDAADYVLASELKDGDEVIIVHQSTNKALSEDDLSAAYPKYRAGVDVVPADGKITTNNSKIVWDVVKTDDGYQLKNDAGATLSATDGLQFGDADTVWTISDSTVAGCYVISSTTATGSSRDPKSIEWSAKYSEFTTFYLNDTNANDFAMQFYVKGGTAPDPGPGPEPTPGNEYVLTSELKEGDEVVIVCAAKNMALSSTYGGNYNNGVAVTPTDGKITNPAADIVWIVGKEGDFYTFSFEGKKIAMGTGYTSMPLGEVNYKWQLQNAATEGAFYLANLDREAGKEYRMQWREEKSYWSAYHTIAEGAEELFALNFYVKGGEAACAHEWDEGKVTTEATCTTAGVKTFTCELCGNTKTESITALGHIDENNDNMCDRCRANLAAGAYSVADTLAVGDKIVLVIEYDGKFYAAANDNKTVNNALNAIEVDVNDKGLILPDGADVVWEVCAGSAEGTFTLKSSDGKYIYYPEKTNVSLADEGSDLTITCGDGTSKILLTSTAEAQSVRNLFLRMNNGVPQFRFYSTVNATTSGYSSVLTIWKAD